MGLHKTCSDSALVKTHPFPNNDLYSTSSSGRWMKVSQDEWNSFITGMQSLSISSEDTTKDFSKTSLYCKFCDGQKKFTEAVNFSTYAKRDFFEALTLADSGTRPKYPGELSEEGAYLQSAIEGEKILASAYQRSFSLLKSNHAFLHTTPELSPETQTSIVNKSHEFSGSFFRGEVKYVQGGVPNGGMSDLCIEQFGDSQVVKKFNPRELCQNCNDVFEEASKALSVDSSHVAKPVAFDKDSVYFELETNGDLFSFAEKHPEQLTAQTVLTITKDIAEALRETHAKHLIHRDIKLENILITRDLRAKLTDFGAAKTLDEAKDLGFLMAGTWMYVAPELCPSSDKIPYNEKIDVWAFGLLVIELILGDLPMPHECSCIDKEVKVYIAECVKKYKISPETPKIQRMAQRKKVELLQKLFTWIQKVLCNHELLKPWIEKQKAENFTLTKNFLKRDPTGKLFEIALSCLKEDPGKRPSMKNIERQLSKIV